MQTSNLRIRYVSRSAILILMLFGAAGLSRANTYTVTNRLDSGPGSLRQAIIDANANPGADTITFSQAVQDSPSTIQIATQLPDLNDSTGGTTIWSRKCEPPR